MSLLPPEIIPLLKQINLWPLSPEVSERLQEYVALLHKWNKAINLVSPSTINETWIRHIVDSAQIFPLLPSPKLHLLDLGSGAGFPGLVLAILGVENVSLIESDQRKSAFLREVTAKAKLGNVQVISARIEDVHQGSILKGQVDAVTARALAPLTDLLAYATPFLAERGICVFLKGRRVLEEIAEARKQWVFKEELLPSLTDSEGVILRIREIRPC